MLDEILQWGLPMIMLPFRGPFAASLVLMLTVAACSSDGSDQSTDEALARLLERASQFELDTEWEIPPGDPLEHSMAGFAKILCSAVFITGRDVGEAAQNAGYFVSTLEERKSVTDTVVDMASRAVHLTLNNGVTLMNG